MSHPVRLVTVDPLLREPVESLAAAAGVQLEVLTEVGAAQWSRPGLLLVGGDVPGPLPGRRPQLVLLCRGAPGPQLWPLAVECGAERVVTLPEAEGWLLDRLVRATEPAASGVVLGVIGGRGGAGASTLAAALAVTAARSGHRTTLVDTDELGGGVDVLLGIEEEAGLRWSDLQRTRGALPAGFLASALPRCGPLAVVTWDRRDGAPAPEEAMQAVVRAAVRDSAVVVLDLPRRLGPAQRRAVAGCSRLFLVVPAEVRAAAAALRVAATLDSLVADVRLVVRGPAPSGLGAETVAELLDLPLAGELRPEPELSVAGDRGDPPPIGSRGPLAQLCRRLVATAVPR